MNKFAEAAACIPPSSQSWQRDAKSGRLSPPPSIPAGCSSCVEPVAGLAAGAWLQHGGLRMNGYHVWGSSVVHWSGDGKFHMFFSRWPSALTHYAWVTSSEVCLTLPVDPRMPSVRMSHSAHRCAENVRG